MRPSLFANLFGVLALFQSGRLVKVRAFGTGRRDWFRAGGEQMVTDPALHLLLSVDTRTKRP
jgi:hypothetical protein